MSLLSPMVMLLPVLGMSQPPSAGCAWVGQDDAEWVDKVVRWMGDRTDEKTGLPVSFDGTVDHAMDGQGAIYDLALAAILLAETCHVDRATRIIDRLEVMWTGRGLPNFVTAPLATTGLESVIHTGPNAWVGLAAHRVWLRGGQAHHLRFSQAIADWIIARRVGHDEAFAPPWIPIPSEDGPARAPAMGPARAFSTVGVVLPWDRIVSIEHVLDTYALLKLLSKAPSQGHHGSRAYQDALADVAATLRLAATNPSCVTSPGVGFRSHDRSGVCIETGFSRDQGWERRFNAADVYYWWIAAIDPDEIAGVRPQSEILAAAQARFEQVVRVGDQRIRGTDYFTCTRSEEDETCASAEVPDEGTKAETWPDAGAGAAGPPASGDASVMAADAKPRIPEAICKLLDVGVCRQRAQGPNEAGFSTFRRTHPMVSVEWTGEAILAGRLVAARSSDAKARIHADRLLDSMNQLATPVKTKTGPGITFPYATDSCECVFDGGWLTPAGRENVEGPLPGALAGTTWVAFARLGINPFRPDLPAPSGGGTLAAPAWPQVQVRERVAEPACPPAQAFDAKQASIETLVTAAWLCLDNAKHDQSARVAIDTWVKEVLQRRVVDVSAMVAPGHDGGVVRIAIEELANSEQVSAQAAGCQFESFALNTVATARLIRALAHRRESMACEDARTIIERYPLACFWNPREVPGEPRDRFEKVHSDWTLLGSSPHLAGPGFHVPVVDVLAKELPACVASVRPVAGSPQAAALDHAVSALGFPWLVDSETHGFVADNLFFSERHTTIAVVQGEVRAGAALEWGPIMVFPFVYGRGIDAHGAPPLDKAVWLRNGSVGGGIEAALGWKRPAWLRDLDVRLGVRGGTIGYHTPAAPPGLSDWEVLASLKGWSLAYFPVGERHGLWVEASAAAFGGQATLWTVDQKSFWLTSKLQMGASILHVIEPYGSVTARGNLLQDTDWDNNLRLGAGARLPLLGFAQGKQKRVSARLDGYWERTVAYWPWVDYVPSFRPLSDLRVSLDIWFAWGGP